MLYKKRDPNSPRGEEMDSSDGWENTWKETLCKRNEVPQLTTPSPQTRERLSEPFHLGHPQTERSHIETMLDVSTQPKPSKSNEKNLEGSFAQISNPLKYRQSREGLFAIKF